MNSIRRFSTTFLAAFAILTATGSTRAAEIFVTALDSTDFDVFPLLKLTYENDSWTFTPITTPVVYLSDLFANITWKGTNGSDEEFYGIASSTGDVSTFSTDGSDVAIGGGGPYNFYGLAYDTTNDTLRGTRDDGTNSTFGTFDTGTGAYTPAGSPIGVSLAGTGGRLAYLNGSYFMTNGSDSNSVFGTVDAGTGVFAPIGSASSDFADLLLTTDGSTLYGLYSAEGSGNIDVYTIDTTTGARTQLGSTITISSLWGIYGAAMVVPEPGTYVLAGLATLAIALAGKRGARHC